MTDAINNTSRPNFKLTGQMTDAIDETVKKYPEKQAALIPCLHIVQDIYGWMPVEAMDALADYMELSRVRVYGVASFYTMIRREPAAKYRLEICTNISCSLLGATHLRNHLCAKLGIKPGETTEDKRFSLEEVECLGSCGTAPVMLVNDKFFENLTPDKVDKIIDNPDEALQSPVPTGDIPPYPGYIATAVSPSPLTKRFCKKDSHKIITYRGDGGYRSLSKVFSMKPEEVIDLVKSSDLRGRGGAGFPTGLKWSFVPKESEKPKYLCINADEGEPGTFKDRYIMSLDPHALIEGAVICAYTFGAVSAYIYVRGEFKEQMKTLDMAVLEARRAGMLGKNILGSGFDFDVFIHPGAGSYVCGEETALIESNEGKRGMPRLKPPFPAVVGLFGGPTVVNNVETLANLPHIINNGADWFKKLGSEKNGGTKLYGVSGHVKKPGLYELPMGTSLKSIIYETCGGIKDDRELKAVIPGGSSTPVLKPDEIDVPMDFDQLMKAGSMLGSGAVIVIDDTVCMVRALARLAKFYAHESCGQCTPCREGVTWISKILHRIEAGNGKDSDIELLYDICEDIQGNTICPLGDACAMPVKGFLDKFKSEFEDHIKKGRCPFGDYTNPWKNK